ncbi:MAG: hypothetical protein KDA78_03480 [Planctomycetaceae bacterium]|nr:hypothetical protein [Planctomycetaceae bacterium]
MTSGIRRLLTAAAIASGVVALMSLSDMILGIPFAGFSIMMDVMFLVSALLILYMIRQCFVESR